MDCIFCKIRKGEIPADKIYEDEHTFAFLDIRPINKGHALVIHKNHHQDIFDTPAEELCAMMATAKKVAEAVVKETNADGVNIGMNNKAVAGQAVWHSHLHIIPRFEGDGLRHWPGKEYEEGEAAKMAEAIKKHL